MNTRTEERRKGWSEGRRWYDQNRGATAIVYGALALLGFGVGFMVGLCR